MNMRENSPTPDEKLQHEFNRWAQAGEAEKMENHHLDITEKTLRLMNLRPGERVLDLGCGSGWATRLLSRLVGDEPEGFGQVVGLDVSDEMIRQARAASRDFENILYVWGSAQQIPWEENFFDKVLSVESFYYYADQDRALMELFRVPLVDLPVIASINRKQWDIENDFDVAGPQVWLSDEGRKKLISIYERRKSDYWRHPVVGRSLSYSRIIELEVRLLEKEWMCEGGLFARMRLR